jgi:16S rRNA (cytosine1402-N4)-methyltransferase
LSHKPVLVQEVLEALNLNSNAIVVDGTLGNGGHSSKILERLGPNGRLVALDQDPASLERCRELASDPRVVLQHENYRNLGEVLKRLHISGVDAVLLDVGFSSNQIEDETRGFSFDRPGPLDMRMNPDNPVSAKDLVNDLSEEELEKIFRDYGEESRARQFAKVIVQERRQSLIETTDRLASVIEKVLFPYGLKRGKRPQWARRHPATRVFQALRIAVNDELGALSSGLLDIWNHIKPGGRFAVITFHSLEDRIVKHQFKNWAQSGEGKLINKKIISPKREEMIDNPRSRSAKLRSVEKLS